MKINELESKIYNLEQRVEYLEKRIKTMQDDSKSTRFEFQKIDFNKLGKENIMQDEIIADDKSLENEGFKNERFENQENKSLINMVKNKSSHFKTKPNHQIKEENKIKSEKQDKVNESLVGKYIIGALASLLVFIGAASFIAIVWHKISPEMKLAIISLTGIILTAVGFKMSLKKSSPISSIIFGTGSGLVYIAILSANLAFHLIGHEVSTILCTLWTAFLMFSYKYTNLYFTVIIAYIGSYINLISELKYINSNTDLILVMVFVTSVSLIMLYNSYESGTLRYSISIFLCTFSYLTVMFFEYFVFERLDIVILELIPVVAIFILKNLFYKLSNKEDIKGVYFILGIISTISIIVFFIKLLFYTNANFILLMFIMFIVSLSQFIINIVFYKNIEKGLSIYYLILMYISIAFINLDTFNIFAGAGIITIILFIKEKFTDSENNLMLPIIMIIFDTIFINSLSYAKDILVTFVYLLLNMALLGYILKNIEKTKKTLIYRNLSMFIILFNCFIITEVFFTLTGLSEHIYDLSVGIGHLIAVIMVFVLYKIEFFAVEDDEEEITDKRKANLPFDAGIYISSTILYFFGLAFLSETNHLIVKFILTISTLAICLMQTYMTIYKKENISSLAGAWFVIKYLLFTWYVMNSFLELPIESVIYSVSGLILSVIAIYLGFRLNIKVTRHFGLAIALLMVAKFIIVDLNGENSITRVISFVVGGVLCFIISIIYNKLSKN